MTNRPTCLGDLMDEKLLNEMIAEGYIRRRPHPTLPLFIYNYSEKAMFDKLWNNATITCRGLIADQHGFIVARPWPKFFNYGEKATLIGSHDTVEITDKADGSLGIGYPTGSGAWAIATRGSFTSDQAVWASRWLSNGGGGFVPMMNITPLFEIVYPENRIVLDYGKWEGLILLGAVDVEMGHLYGPYEAAGMLQWNGQTTEVFPERTMAEFMSSPNANRSNAEGVVVRSGHRMVKIKQESYVLLHKIITGLSKRSVWEAMLAGKTIQEICEPLPDELHVWTCQVYFDLWTRTRAIENQVEVEYEKHDCLTRKMFAEAVRESPLRPWLFLRYDGRNIEQAILTSLKPTADSRWGVEE